MKKLLAFLVCCIQTGYAQSAAPQNTDTASAPATAIQPVAPVTPTAPSIKKTDAHTLSVERYFINKNRLSKSTNFYVDYYLKVKVDSAAFNMAQNSADTICLWMGGICFRDLPLLFTTSDKAFIFQLQLDSSKASPWKLFYAYPQYISCTKHSLDINAGTTKLEFKKLHAKQNILYSSSTWMILLAYALFIAMVVLILTFGSSVLKDAGFLTKSGVIIDGKKNAQTNADAGIISMNDVPYSMARSQFLFWLIIIFFSILHIWGYTDSLATPTGTVLLLLGISGGTFYIGTLIDKTSSNANPVASGTPASPTRAEIINKVLSNKSDKKGSLFLYDILNDGYSISLHRLQLFMFTIFLGIYFLWFVVYNLQMPQFSDTMMTLMGISSAAYAGLKTTEQ